MPRHIRSVKARHPRKYPAKNAPPVGSPLSARVFAAIPPSAKAHVPPSAQAELLAGLRQAFLDTPEVVETIARTRERYVVAVEAIANYLEDIGADAAWIEHLDELRWALEDLTNGEIPELLKPTTSKIRSTT